MKKLYTIILVLISLNTIAFANQSPTASQVGTNCSSWSKNLNCGMTNQQLVDNAVDQLSTGSAAIWGGITGTLSNQTDLQSALNAKQNSLTTGTTTQYFRGDLSLANFPTNLNQFTNGPGYITGNQTITLSGPVTGSGTTTIVTALAALGVQGNNINWTSVNALINSSSINWPGIGNYSSGFMKWNGSNPPSQDTNTYLTGNQTITLSGDISGSGTTAITTILPTVNSNPGTFQGITVNGKGQVTAGTNQNYLSTVTADSPLSGLGTPASHLIFTSPGYITNVGIGTSNTITYWSATNSIGSLNTGTYPSLTELSYVKGVTSAIQTQINSIGTNNWIYTSNVGIGTFGNVSIGSSIPSGNGALQITGNVGIGSSSPGGLLDIEGTVGNVNFFKNTTTASGTDGSSLNVYRNGTYITNYVDQYGEALIDSNASHAYFFNSTTGPVSFAQNTSSMNFEAGSSSASNTASFFNTNGTLTVNGNVGIGSSNPGSSLDVKGTVNGTRFFGNVNVLNGNVGIGTSTPQGAFVVTNGNVGIGTWAPAASFQIGIPNSETTINGSTIQTNSSSTQMSQNSFTASAGITTGAGFISTLSSLTSGQIANWTISSGSFTGQALNINVSNASASGNAIKTTNAGTGPAWIDTGTGNLNVGIGSATPGQLLDVNGTIRVSKLGGTLAIASGTNGCMGQATLSSGTVTVITACTPSTSQGIFLQDATTGSLVNVGTPTVGTVTGGTSFVINSSNALDTSNVNWWILKSS